jgi:hypothetical protein
MTGEATVASRCRYAAGREGTIVYERGGATIVPWHFAGAPGLALSSKGSRPMIPITKFYAVRRLLLFCGPCVSIAPLQAGGSRGVRLAERIPGIWDALRPSRNNYSSPARGKPNCSKDGASTEG